VIGLVLALLLPAQCDGCRLKQNDVQQNNASANNSRAPETGVIGQLRERLGLDNQQATFRKKRQQQNQPVSTPAPTPIKGTDGKDGKPGADGKPGKDADITPILTALQADHSETVNILTAILNKPAPAGADNTQLLARFDQLLVKLDKQAPPTIDVKAIQDAISVALAEGLAANSKQQIVMITQLLDQKLPKPEPPPLPSVPGYDIIPAK
jgi:hypothetical protein